MDVIMWLLPYVILLIEIGLLSGIVGSYIHTRRIYGIVGGLAHFILGPIGISYALSFIIGKYINVTLFSMLSLILVAMLLPIDEKGKVKIEKEIQVLWGTGMALGLFIMFILPDYLNLDTFLFGSVITISNTSIIMISIVTVIVLILEIFFHNRFVFLGVDDDSLILRGINARMYHRIQLLIIVVTISVLLEGIGVLLMLSILTIPASIVSLFLLPNRSFMLLSTLFAIASLLTGLFISYFFDLQISSSTTLILGITYFIFKLFVTTRKNKYL